MISLAYALTLALLASGNPANSLPSCKVSVYALSAKGVRAKQPFLLPAHFASVTDAGPGMAGGQSWRFELTPKGKAINASYTAAHQGQKIAFFCGSREILRPIIQGPSSDVFVIESPP